jgi:large subunit ribosomal protein L23
MNAERILNVLNCPLTSEKTTRLADKNKQFTFKVVKTATKQEVKAAVEQLFNVKVKGVTVVNVAGKQKRFRQSLGKRSDWKKAYVSLQEGFDINYSVAE